MFKFSGVGEVTKIFENPYAIAAAILIPIPADLPLPLPAVNETVYLNCFYVTESTNDIIHFA